jgi:predicted RNase H-like HicB family nuclease
MTCTLPNARRSARSSQGRTVEEAVSNLKEATKLYLEEFPQTEERRAILTTFEVSSVASS